MPLWHTQGQFTVYFSCLVSLRRWKFQLNGMHEKYFYVTFMVVVTMNVNITVLRYVTSSRLASIVWNARCQKPETAILKYFCLFSIEWNYLCTHFLKNTHAKVSRCLQQADECLSASFSKGKGKLVNPASVRGKSCFMTMFPKVLFGGGITGTFKLGKYWRSTHVLWSPIHQTKVSATRSVSNQMEGSYENSYTNSILNCDQIW